MKKILFIDRDGTIIREPEDEQIDSFEKLQFVPRAISNLIFLRQHTDYEFVMVSNQDGLGTDAFPEDTFWPVQNFISLKIMHLRANRIQDSYRNTLTTLTTTLPTLTLLATVKQTNSLLRISAVSSFKSEIGTRWQR